MPQKTKTDRLTDATELSVAANQHKNFVTQLEISLLIYVLKKFSSKEKPLYASKIAQYIGLITGEVHSPKTIKRKLDMLCQLQNSEDEDAEMLSNTLFHTFGGSVMEATNEDAPNIKTVHARFYFQPLLDASDVALICGAITSNRYLTPQEKKYLLSRQQTLSICDDTAENVEEVEAYTFTPQLLPPKPIPNNRHAHNLLHLVNQLHNAIENQYQIQIIYGIYDSDPNNFKKIRFHARNEHKPYTLNPYALLWNHGAYYLLATHDGHDNPVHFRVDRIISVKSKPMEADATKRQPRAPIPEMLKPFFEPEGTELNVEKYTATYPLMGIYDDADTQSCLIECTATTLSILIDHFGMNLHIQPSPLPHGEEELDFHGNPQRFFAVQIKQVQYDNILQFCLQQHSSITALRPARLVEDIQKGLQQTLQKYQRVTDSLTS